MKTKKPGLLKSVFMSFTQLSWPFPAGSQNRDGFERNADNPLNGAAVYSQDAVLRLSAAWACVRLLAETISTLPLHLYERRPDGTRRDAKSHPLYDLLHTQPNADMTAQTFWEAYLASMLLWGNAYGEKRYVGGRIVAIDFLNPAAVTPFVTTDGRLRFRYSTGIGQAREIDEADMFHTLGFSTNGRLGLSVISYGAGVFRSAISADTAASNTFDNGLMPTVAFTMEAVLKKDQRDEFREDFRNQMAGALNAGKPPLLEGGMSAQPIGINPVDAQLLESRAWSVEEICRWFRVPPFMVGHSEKSTSWGTGIEQQMIGFLTFSLRPWLTRVEQSITRSLIGAQRDRYFAEFSVEGLLRADSAGRAEYLSKMTQNGLMTRDEGRAYDNRPPMGGNAAVLTVQSALLPIDKLGTTAPKPEATPQ